MNERSAALNLDLYLAVGRAPDLNGALKNIWANFYFSLPSSLSLSLSLTHTHTHTYKILTHDLKLAPSFFGIIQKLERILHYCFFKNVLFSAIFCQNLAIPSLFLSKMGHLRPLFHILVFSTHFELLQQINVKKCPSNMGRRDSNPRPLKHELSPITTRPGLLPYLSICLSNRLAIISTISSKNEIRKTFIFSLSLSE